MVPLHVTWFAFLHEVPGHCQVSPHWPQITCGIKGSGPSSLRERLRINDDPRQHCRCFQWIDRFTIAWLVFEHFSDQFARWTCIRFNVYQNRIFRELFAPPVMVDNYDPVWKPVIQFLTDWNRRLWMIRQNKQAAWRDLFQCLSRWDNTILDFRIFAKFIDQPLDVWVNVILVQNDPAFFAVHRCDPANSKTSPDRIHIRPFMTHYKDLIRLLQQFAQGLGNHPRPNPCPFGHRIRLSAIEPGFAIRLPDNDLVTTPPKGKVQVGLR